MTVLVRPSPTDTGMAALLQHKQSALGDNPPCGSPLHIGCELSILVIRKHVILWDIDAVHTIPQQSEFQ